MIFPPLKDGSPLGLGGAPLGNLFAAMADQDAHAIINAALAAGCRCFDTAPHYGNGLSELRLGHALCGIARNDFVVSSKVGRLLLAQEDAPENQNGYVNVLPFVQAWDYSRAGVRRPAETASSAAGCPRRCAEIGRASCRERVCLAV